MILFFTLMFLFWGGGIAFVYYHFVTGCFVLQFGVDRRTDGLFILLLAFCFCYLISLSLGLIQVFGAGYERFIASFYSLTFWLCLLFWLRLPDKFVKKIELDKWSDFAFIIVLVVILLAYVFEVCCSFGELNFDSVFSKYMRWGEGRLLLDLSRINIFYPEYGSFGVDKRFSLFSPYPTAFAQLVVCFYFLAIMKGRGVFNISLIWLCCLYLIYISGSRAVLLGFIMSSILPFFGGVVGRRFALVFVLGVGLFLSFFMFIFYEDLMGLIEKINSLRASSSSLRFDLYSDSLLYWIEHNFWFGGGIKPRGEEYFVPIGSHSTYLGVLVRTGIIGGVFFFLFVLSLLFRGVIGIFNPSRIVRVSSSAMISFLLFMAFEDLDVLPFVFFFFSCFIVLGRKCYVE